MRPSAASIALPPDPASRRRRRDNLFLLFGVGLGWFLLDQLAKYWVVADLTTLFPADAGLGDRLGLFFGHDDLKSLATAPAPIFGTVWEHLYVQNPAGAFSFLLSLPLGVRKSLLLLAAGLASIGIGAVIWRKPDLPRGRSVIPLGFVLGGALGNFLDRALHGYVIDFLHWQLGSFSWPPFNLADAGIVVGVLFVMIFGSRDNRKAKTLKVAHAASTPLASPRASKRR